MGKAALGATALLASCAVAGFVGQASAETFVEHSAEVRMQLDFVVPDAALKTFLPAGWEPNVATSGAAKDCNLRMIFIDRVDITKQDGSPATPGSNQLVYLAVPIKQPSTNTNGQMLIFGLTADPKDAPGAHRLRHCRIECRGVGGLRHRRQRPWIEQAKPMQKREPRLHRQDGQIGGVVEILLRLAGIHGERAVNHHKVHVRVAPIDHGVTEQHKREGKACEDRDKTAPPAEEGQPVEHIGADYGCYRMRGLVHAGGVLAEPLGQSDSAYPSS